MAERSQRFGVRFESTHEKNQETECAEPLYLVAVQHRRALEQHVAVGERGLVNEVVSRDDRVGPRRKQDFLKDDQHNPE